MASDAGLLLGFSWSQKQSEEFSAETTGNGICVSGITLITVGRRHQSGEIQGDKMNQRSTET